MMRYFLILYLIAQVLSFRINPNTQFFEDDAGRSLILHGVNIVAKSPPYIPITSYFDPHMSVSKEDLVNMQMWGFNFVRLGVMWEAVETSPGVYNQTYLSLVDQLITSLGESGVYVFVDAHQDLFANKICGEGVPNFYAQNLNENCNDSVMGRIFHIIGQCKSIKEYGIRFDDKGNPLIEDCLKHNFQFYYLSPEVANAFDNFFNNVNGLQDKFLAFWDVVSKKFASNPYVVGYDLFNEPWPGDLYNEVKNWLPGHVDEKYLQPLYQKVHDTIRKNDNEKIIFFEPVQFPDTFAMFNGLIYSTGFTDTPGGSQYKSKVVLNDHSYCCQISANACEKGEPSIDIADKCRDFHLRKLKQRKQDAKKYGVSLIISEFGACFNTDSCVEEISSLTEACDENLVSWNYWQFKDFGDFTTFSGKTEEGLYLPDGTLQQSKLKALTRTYGSAYQGVPLESRFNRTNGYYYTKFLLDLSISQPTEIYFHKELYYPNGVNVDVKSDEVYDVKIGEDNRVRVLFTGTQNFHDEKEVEIVLTQINSANK